jgi:F-type H+-transporting ATPase subunit delta
MIREAAAKRYAQAAFELAREGNALDAWERDLRNLRDVLAVPGALAFVSSRQADAETKLSFLRQAAGELTALAQNLVRLLAQKGRLTLLPQIAEHFQELVDEERGVAHAQVATAVPLSDDERRALGQRLSEMTGKQVDVEVHEVPEILGGLIARIGDRLIDGSTRSKLVALKRRLAGATR